MRENKMDKAITEFLMKESEDITSIEEKLWANIHSELFTIDRSKTIYKKRRIRLASIITVAVIITVIWTGLMTTTGQAFIQNLKEMFVGKQEIELNIEGQKEDSTVELETNEKLRYIIYVDKSMYKLVKGGNKDKIVPKEDLGEKYPEVAVEIWREEKSADEAIDFIKNKVQKQSFYLHSIEAVTEPFASTMIKAYGDKDTEHDWDTPIHKYYITDTVNGHVFVIKQMYFLEASEGHGARFDQMLENFEIVYTK